MFNRTEEEAGVHMLIRIMRQNLLFMLVVFIFTIGISAYARAVSSGYQTTEEIQIGSVVSVKGDNPNAVERATLANQQLMIGVVVGADDTLIAFSSDDTNIQVATEGTVAALASDINGEIKSGDYLSVSPIAGVAMKADDQQPRILGVAQSGFSAEPEPRTIDGPNGPTEIKVGTVPINLSITDNPDYLGGTSYLPAFMREAAETIAGKEVSPIRILLASVILLLTLIGTTVLVYGAVHSSIISIGRNPFSRGSVFRGLVQVLFIVIVILGIGLAAVYLTLAVG